MQVLGNDNDAVKKQTHNSSLRGKHTCREIAAQLQNNDRKKNKRNLFCWFLNGMRVIEFWFGQIEYCEIFY